MPQNKRKKDDIIGGVDLPGWPGYRTRHDRSGLDPLDTRSEAAHMQGTLLRNLFTLRARTRNPFYLLLMFLFGVIPFIVLATLGIGGMPDIGTLSVQFIIYFGLVFFVLAMVTLNFILSLLEIFNIFPARKIEKKPRGKREKKLPKRRKDFH